jgi:hypothetical protein
MTLSINDNQIDSNPHLSGEQLAELLVAVPTGLGEEHLRSCEPCSAELASLRQSLAFFREAGIAYANSVHTEQTASRSPDWIGNHARPQRFFHPAYWVAAAAMLMTAVLLPMHTRHAGVQPPIAVSQTSLPAQSDEALLEDINRDISASVPAPMQALDDPTGTQSASAQQ